MSEAIDRDSLPRATLTPGKRSRISAVWLIPLVAAIVAIGIAVHRILNEGPTIHIVFKSAEGVEAGKTFIRYKDVKIGEVTAIELHKNYSKVKVTAQINKHDEGLMVQDAKFWVVQPRITLSGVSGLGTLLSGNYIGFERGTSQSRQSSFIGLETAPVVTMDQAGRQFMLTADDLGSLGVGSPIYFRRLNVGQVMAYDLDASGRGVNIRIFVNAPYDRFVTRGTRFWNASGLDVSLGTSGVDLRTQSLISLLIGGLAFETPTYVAATDPAGADTTFALYTDRTTAMKQPETVARHYVVYFNNSLRGLSVGAPVTLLGLPAGEVTDVGIDVDPKALSLRGRVEIVTYPDRIIAHLQEAQTATGKDIVGSEQQSRVFLQRLIEERGLRAQLRSGSLITGQLYVAFDFYPDADKAEIDWSQDIPVVPAVPATLPDLEARITGILDKLDKVPYEAIGVDVAKTLETLNETIEHFNFGVTPVLKSAIGDIRRVLENIDTTLVGRNAPGQLELRNALQEIARAARSVRVLADYLERNPGALLRGKSGSKP